MFAECRTATVVIGCADLLEAIVCVAPVLFVLARKALAWQRAYPRRHALAALNRGFPVWETVALFGVLAMYEYCVVTIMLHRSLSRSSQLLALDDRTLRLLPSSPPDLRPHKPSRLLWKDPSTLSSIAVALVADVGGVGGAACDNESIDAVSWAMNAWASKRHPAVIGTIVTLFGDARCGGHQNDRHFARAERAHVTTAFCSPPLNSTTAPLSPSLCELSWRSAAKAEKNSTKNIASAARNAVVLTSLIHRFPAAKWYLLVAHPSTFIHIDGVAAESETWNHTRPLTIGSIARVRANAWFSDGAASKFLKHFPLVALDAGVLYSRAYALSLQRALLEPKGRAAVAAASSAVVVLPPPSVFRGNTTQYSSDARPLWPIPYADVREGEAELNAQTAADSMAWQALLMHVLGDNIDTAWRPMPTHSTCFIRPPPGSLKDLTRIDREDAQSKRLCAMPDRDGHEDQSFLSTVQRWAGRRNAYPAGFPPPLSDTRVVAPSGVMGLLEPLRALQPMRLATVCSVSLREHSSSARDAVSAIWRAGVDIDANIVLHSVRPWRASSEVRRSEFDTVVPNMNFAMALCRFTHTTSTTQSRTAPIPPLPFTLWTSRALSKVAEHRILEVVEKPCAGYEMDSRNVRYVIGIVTSALAGDRELLALSFEVGWLRAYADARARGNAAMARIHVVIVVAPHAHARIACNEACVFARVFDNVSACTRECQLANSSSANQRTRNGWTGGGAQWWTDGAGWSLRAIIERMPGIELLVCNQCSDTYTTGLCCRDSCLLKSMHARWPCAHSFLRVCPDTYIVAQNAERVLGSMLPDSLAFIGDVGQTFRNWFEGPPRDVPFSWLGGGAGWALSRGLLHHLATPLTIIDEPVSTGIDVMLHSCYLDDLDQGEFLVQRVGITPQHSTAFIHLPSVSARGCGIKKGSSSSSPPLWLEQCPAQLIKVNHDYGTDKVNNTFLLMITST